MTTGTFALIDYRTIDINREGRQRRNLDVSDLVADIRRVGLINPPLVRRSDLRLVAGERRVTACLELGAGVERLWPVQWAEDLPEQELQLIELQENLIRVDLCWQDQLQARAKIHELLVARDPEWTMAETAGMLGVSQGYLSRQFMVLRSMDDPEISQSDTWAGALNITLRRRQRESARELEEVFLAGDEMLGQEPPLPTGPKPPGVSLPPKDWFPEPDASDPAADWTPLPVEPSHVSAPSGRLVERELAAEESLPDIFVPRDPIQHADFVEWSRSYTGKPFNFIHCDFPYGVGLFEGKQAGGERNGQYDDSEETYKRLVQALVEGWPRLASISCHLIFWYSEKHGPWTREALRGCKDLVLSPFPLVWFKSDNTGIIGDARRSPRHVYETALFGHTAGRNIVKSVGDCYPAPTPPKSAHASVKSEPMLRHFFRMTIESETRMLDPTCGSGGAIRVAEELGAKECTGLEVDGEMAKRASDYVRRSRLLRGAGK